MFGNYKIFNEKVMKKEDDDFIALPVNKLKIDASDDDYYAPEFDITFGSVDKNKLPYNDSSLLDPSRNQELKDIGVERDDKIRFVNRGDNRSVKQIKEAGGFLPKCVSGGCNLESLNVRDHREAKNNGWDSAFVSTTTKPNVPHQFGLMFADNNGSGEYTLFGLKITGGMKPSDKIYEDEKEYSAVGGTEFDVGENNDKDGIVCFRNCNFNTGSDNTYSTECSDLFFSKNFVKNSSKETILTIAETQLFKGETLILDENDSRDNEEYNSESEEEYNSESEEDNCENEEDNTENDVKIEEKVEITKPQTEGRKETNTDDDHYTFGIRFNPFS